jgi:hypothetical protein
LASRRDAARRTFFQNASELSASLDAAFLQSENKRPACHLLSNQGTP